MNWTEAHLMGDLEAMEERMSQSKTMGQHRVGVDFNPSHLTVVDEIKQRAADLIDMIDELPNPGNDEITRLKAIAMTEIETGCMYAVKAAVRSM